jgi:hypothetical protein
MTAQPVPVAVEVPPPQPEPAPRPDGWDRLWARLRSLFVPSVTVSAVLAAKGEEDAAAAVLQLYDWERDRLLTLAKGAGAAAVTVLTGLVASAFKAEIEAAWVVYPAAGLVVLLLGWGGFLLTGLHRLAEEYTTALELVR